MRDRNDAGPADQAERWFDAGQRRRARRADDRPIGFGADTNRREVGGNGGACAGTRSARIAIERVRISDQPTTAAPTARRVRRSEIRPLAHVGLAEEYRACLA